MKLSVKRESNWTWRALCSTARERVVSGHRQALSRVAPGSADRVKYCAGALFLALGAIDAQPRAWVIDQRPAVILGRSESDTADMFAAVAGATRLPDGRIIVGDRAAFALRLFTADGKSLRNFGRKGSGPGEIEYLLSLLRCGDSLLTRDVASGHRVSVFSLDGRYVRSFRFGSPQGGSSPYRSVCNGNREFAHYGWENMKDVKSGVYRQRVPFWLSGPDSSVRSVFGSFSGSERHAHVVDGQLRGSRPLPLGKEPVIAIGRDRVYIGTADQYEILVFDFSGKQAATIKKPNVSLVTTKDDIEYAKEKEIGGGGERVRASVERGYAEMTLPKTIPAYASLVVDSDDYLWVQDYPRAKGATVRWSVFDRAGNAVTEVGLPTHLEVYEVGRDYVLGRYLDPDEQVPEVRLYRLSRR